MKNRTAQVDMLRSICHRWNDVNDWDRHPPAVDGHAGPQSPGGIGRIAFISGNGYSIYYDPASPANAYLNDQTYALTDGGSLAPVPEPREAVLLIATVLMLAAIA